MALKTVTSLNETTGLVTVTTAGSPSRDIAAALLEAADDPSQVRTATTRTGMGWVVPKTVAEKAGLLAKPSNRTTTSTGTGKTT